MRRAGAILMKSVPAPIIRSDWGGLVRVTSGAERAELIDLRKRLKRAETERDILKKATAFFAKENA